MINQVWKTIRIGGVSPETLLEQIKAACPKEFHNIDDSARDLMRRECFKVAPEARQVALMKLSVRDLGFTEVPSVSAALARIQEIDGLCPAEVGPHLLLQGTGDKDYLRIAMRPHLTRVAWVGKTFKSIFLIEGGEGNLSLSTDEVTGQCRSLDMKFVVLNALASRSGLF